MACTSYLLRGTPEGDVVSRMRSPYFVTAERSGHTVTGEVALIHNEAAVLEIPDRLPVPGVLSPSDGRLVLSSWRLLLDASGSADADGDALVFCWVSNLSGLLYEGTGSLWPCVALHSAVNALAFLAAYALEVHPELFTGP